MICSFVSVFLLSFWFSSAQSGGESSGLVQNEMLEGSYLKSESSPETLPEEIQVPLLLKILTYDRSMEGKAKDTLRIGVLYYPNDDQSKKNKNSIMEYLKNNKDKTINGIPFSFVEIGFISGKQLGDAVTRKNIMVLYITSDGNHTIKEISELTQTKKILTMTGRVDYVDLGISVGLGIEDEKSQIVINLPSARAEGSDFSAKLLKLCKIVN
ncbi:MAG: YfiR family protein [Candidatus Zixiibacteriota bacterium]